jgi:molybdopterin-guanine dinucleotide biosynthesis protein A
MSGFDDVTGAILIGGMSHRLGRDKILLSFEGKPLAVHAAGIFEDMFQKTDLIGHPRRELTELGYTCVPDLIPGKGVLGGIYTALHVGETPYVFIVAADMPFLTPSLISGILAHRHNADAVIPVGPKGMEPLCAVYSKACTGTVKRSLERNELKIIEALDGLKILSPEIGLKDGEPDPFININCPEDLIFLGKNDH